MRQFLDSLQIADVADDNLSADLQHRLDQKTKPVGSLGRLESLALQLGLIQGSTAPALLQPQMLVCAGDHGLAARGVSAYPSDVTWQMVENFLAGGAAVSVLSRQHGIALTVADCGVRHEFAPRPGLVNCKVAPGTADSLAGRAMTEAQCEQAVRNGQQLVLRLPGNALLIGEMGIGNTSAASLLLARLARLDVADVTGAGTGLDQAGVARKTEVLQAVLARHPDATTPWLALQAFGGFEIATLVGAVLQAAAQRRVVVVDGFIASCAVLVASQLAPATLGYCVFAHRSGERGHARMLDVLEAKPLLDMSLRLGEGSGAALAWPMLVSACHILNDMASFASAGVSRKSE